MPHPFVSVPTVLPCNISSFLVSYPCSFLLQPIRIHDGFCGLALNQPIGGLQVIEGIPLLEEKVDGMASVAAYSYNEHSVVFVGTRAGTLKKVRSHH